MRKQLKKSTQFKKDLKRYLHQPSKLLALKTVTLALEETGRVPEEYQPHMLSLHDVFNGEFSRQTVIAIHRSLLVALARKLHVIVSNNEKQHYSPYR